MSKRNTPGRFWCYFSDSSTKHVSNHQLALNHMVCSGISEHTHAFHSMFKSPTMQWMVDQGRSDFYVVFSMSLCTIQPQKRLQICYLKPSGFEIRHTGSVKLFVNMSFICFQIQKLSPQRIMLKTK